MRPGTYLGLLVGPSVLSTASVSPVDIDDCSCFVQFNSDQLAFFHSLCFLSFLRQRKHFLAVGRLQLDLLFHPANVDELAGHLTH